MTRQPTHIKIIKYSSSTLKHNDDYHIKRHITEDRSLGTVGLIASMKHHRQKDHPSSTSHGLIFLFILSCRQYLARWQRDTYWDLCSMFYLYLLIAAHGVLLCYSVCLKTTEGRIEDWYLNVDKYSSLARCVLCGGWLIMTQRATLSSWQLINQSVSRLNTENGTEIIENFSVSQLLLCFFQERIQSWKKIEYSVLWLRGRH